MIDNKYNIEISKEDFHKYLSVTKNSVFKLLCSYEEKEDWEKSLDTILYEIGGVCNLFNNKVSLIKITSKLESLKNKNMTMKFFRKTIFEVLTLIDKEIST